MTASTKNGVTTRYEYAGADLNKLLKQSTDGGADHDYTYGKGITSRTVVGTGTASVISDPTTGQPLDLQTTDDVTSMWVVDGVGNPTAAIADTGNTAFTVSCDPYGAETLRGVQRRSPWTGGFSCTAGAGGLVTGSVSSSNTSPVPTDYSGGCEGGVGGGAGCGVDFT
ncbi:hypothetical protein [Curtobacterium sp. B18]|uniref:hypothetical protein n=1 Tax=Curtobacterium sp. B18 TaxID=95614 RepID=UPI0003B7675C|nr:hypothetical protein [Curtobacterium sp. B18]